MISYWYSMIKCWFKFKLCNAMFYYYKEILFTFLKSFEYNAHLVAVEVCDQLVSVFVVEMPMPLAKTQSVLMSMLPIPPMLTIDQCKILSEADNIVSNNHLTLEDLNVKPSDVEEAMKKWLWRYRDGGQFAKVQ